MGSASAQRAPRAVWQPGAALFGYLVRGSAETVRDRDHGSANGL